MIRYEFRRLDVEIAEQLIHLSELWVQENCSHGMVKNTGKDLREPLAVALDDNRIVGYIMGHYYSQENSTSYIPMGQSCFSVDELYVHPEYRSMGIGGRLFRMMEALASEKCGYITLATSTRDYKRILKLYIEELGMDFHSAFLIKKTGRLTEEGKICE